MKFGELAEYLERLATTTLRNEMMEVLSELLTTVDEHEVKQTVYLVLGRLRPKYEKLEFNLAEKMVVRAIAQAVAKSIDQVDDQYKKIGDLGEVVVDYRGKSSDHSLSQGSELTVEQVYEEMVKIASDSGQGSHERKVTRLAKLIGELDAQSSKYVVRIVMGKLRLGFSDKTILDALSYMESGSKENRKKLDYLYQIAPDVGELARLVKLGGVAGASGKIKIELGRPVAPSLAQRIPSADEMIKKMGKVIAEPKFDGTRVQIHFSRNKVPNTRLAQGSELVQTGLFGKDEKPSSWVRTFTRNLDENTEMFPELARMGEQTTANELILDSEAVGYDPVTGKMMPFQMTITRKRKHGVEEASSTVPLKFYVFDVLYLDGESLLNKPLHERREILGKIIKINERMEERKNGGDVLVVDELIVTESARELRDFHKQQLDMGLEGAVVKKYDGVYEPGRQGFNWVKFKEEEGEEGKLSDTVDAVVMGYYVGKGKRQKFGLGAFLVGIKDNDNAKIWTIAKVGTGLSDVQFGELYQRLQECISRKIDESYVVDKSLYPDVWVAPRMIVEIAADEITKSPVHSSGYALRFPRLVRFRDDKELAETTSTKELLEIAGIV